MKLIERGGSTRRSSPRTASRSRRRWTGVRVFASGRQRRAQGRPRRPSPCRSCPSTPRFGRPSRRVSPERRLGTMTKRRRDVPSAVHGRASCGSVTRACCGATRTSRQPTWRWSRTARLRLPTGQTRARATRCGGDNDVRPEDRARKAPRARSRKIASDAHISVIWSQANRLSTERSCGITLISASFPSRRALHARGSSGASCANC